MENRKFGTGYINFKRIIQKNDCYVDKTLLIRDILDLGSQKVVLFTRPRRFGKSLNCNMVKTFLELEVDAQGQPLPEDKKENRTLFQDLKIAKESSAMAELGCYPVIDLTFGGIKEETWSECYSRIQDRLATLYGKFDFLLEKNFLKKLDIKAFVNIMEKTATLIDTKLSLKKLSDHLFSYYKKQVVILIDEYDAILTYANTSKSPYYTDAALPFMQTFFTEALKDNQNLRLGYLTGIFYTAQASIFSLLNNLQVFTVTTNKCSQHFGFTDSEVRELAEQYGIKDKMDEIRNWYKGYKFGKSEIYNPWSILGYFANDFVPKPYWVNTSDNLLVYELITATKLKTKSNIINFIAENTITSGIKESVNYEDIKYNDRSLWTFLLSTGYLKPEEDYDESDESKIYTLIPPNKELNGALKNLFRHNIDVMFGLTDLTDCIDCIINGDVVNFQIKINGIISSTISNRKYHELFCHELIIGLISVMKDRLAIQTEKESGDGYPDLICVPKSDKDHNGLVIEIMSAKDPYDPKDIFDDNDKLTKHKYSKFKGAFAQITTQNYQNILVKEGKVKDVLKYALVFSKKGCNSLLQVNNEQVLKSGDGSSITLEELDQLPNDIRQR